MFYVHNFVKAGIDTVLDRLLTHFLESLTYQLRLVHLFVIGQQVQSFLLVVLFDHREDHLDRVEFRTVGNIHDRIEP